MDRRRFSSSRLGWVFFSIFFDRIRMDLAISGTEPRPAMTEVKTHRSSPRCECEFLKIVFDLVNLFRFLHEEQYQTGVAPWVETAHCALQMSPHFLHFGFE